MWTLQKRIVTARPPPTGACASPIDTPSGGRYPGVVEHNDLHWLAGLLEGEGTFLAGPPSAPETVIVRVAMTDRDVVERAGRLLERAVVPLRARQPHHRQAFGVTVRGTAAASLMSSLRPLLGLARNVQIDTVLARWGHGRKRWSSAGPCAAEGCALTARIRGLCDRHYDRWYKASRRDAKPGVAPRDLTRAEILDYAPQLAGCSDECEVQWLAGLLEGEGSFGVAVTNGRAYPTITLQMCDQDVVERAARMLGAPSVLRSAPRNDRWSALFAARLTGDAAASWMRRLRPLMGARRTAAIDRALAAYRPIRLVRPPAECIVGGCAAPHRARGLCHAHYMSWSRDRVRGQMPRVTPLR